MKLVGLIIALAGCGPSTTAPFQGDVFLFGAGALESEGFSTEHFIAEESGAGPRCMQGSAEVPADEKPELVWKTDNAAVLLTRPPGGSTFYSYMSPDRSRCEAALAVALTKKGRVGSWLANGMK